MSTLDQALETALKLPYEQQEMLIRVLKQRYIEVRREEIATNAQKSLAEFRAGHYKIQSVEEAIIELRRFLDEADK
ncbi:MAG: hypothetical protein AAF810_23660 [Cyanobacteria bacterium P01_D01_bin.36]